MSQLRPWDADLVRRAGLETRHIAKLMGIHKITASNWLNRDITPNRFLRDKVSRLMEALELGLEDGTLPAPTVEHLRLEADNELLSRVEQLMGDDK